MESFTPNGCTRNRRSQLRVRNGAYRNRNGGGAFAGGSSPQMMGSLSKENVPKSRSNEWYMLSPSQAERNNNHYCKDVHFPKSVTSGILAPDVFRYPEYYRNRTLRGPMITAGKWPNSIEDPERETTRSSVSVEDTMERRKGDECSVCTPLIGNSEDNLTESPPPRSKAEETDVRLETPVQEIPFNPTDSLPRHRERLSQRRKHGRRVSSTPESTKLKKSERAGSHSETSSTSDLTSCADDVGEQKYLQKIHPERMTPNFSQARSRRDAYFASSKRPCDLKLCGHDHNANSLANVGSWLANQSFDWIDSSYSHLPSMDGSETWCGYQHDFTRRPEEIAFGTPTPRDVTFNVSGQYYKIDPKILERFPETLLGNQEKRAKYWDPLRNEYFLDRHRATFEVVIDYYLKNGVLHRPDDIPIDIFIHEIKFYCLDRENIHDFLSREGILLVVKEKPMPNTPTKQFIWKLFEDPESGWTARLVTTMSAMVIAISVVVFCMETVPAFHSLGESSLENIGPALNRCERVLKGRPELFHPIGQLFAEQTKDHDLRPCERKDAEEGEEETKPRSHHKRKRRSDEHLAEKLQSAGIQNSVIDDFDSQIVISTMQKTLSLCASEEDMDVLTKYTLLRCDIELADAFAYTGTPIQHILSEVEVHECPHAHGEEGEEHHEESGNEHHDDDDVMLRHNEDDEEEDHASEAARIIPNHNRTNYANLTTEKDKHKDKAARSEPTRLPWVLAATRSWTPQTFSRSVTNHTQTSPQSLISTPKSKASKRVKVHSKHKARIAKINVNEPYPTTSSKKKNQRKNNRAHRRKRKKGNKSTKKNPRKSKRKRNKRDIEKHSISDEESHNLTMNVTDGSQLLTLRQTIIALNHVCSELDKHSYRSSYNWFVLEASLGGPAGQLFLIESGCIVWFVIELALRAYSCPDKIKFCTNFLNIIDAIAILPYFITLIVTSLHTDSNLRPQTATILRTIRLVRMLRILKLSRHSRGLRILGLTLVRSTRVLVLLVCFQMVLAVTFSSIVYYVEYDAEGTSFKSIPGSFWWAIITMTTVGYGDVVPITTWGRITGAFCAIMGILGIAFPVPVIVSNFNYLYNLDSDECKLTPEELMGNKEEDERNTVVERFQENLFDAVRRNVGSMTGAPQEGQPTGQNPAELWNYTRRQYHGSDKKAQKPPDPGRSNKYKFNPLRTHRDNVVLSDTEA